MHCEQARQNLTLIRVLQLSMADKHLSLGHDCAMLSHSLYEMGWSSILTQTSNMLWKNIQFYMASIFQSFFCPQERFQAPHLLSVQYLTLAVQSKLKVSVLSI